MAILLGLMPLRDGIEPSALLRRQQAVNAHTHHRPFLCDGIPSHLEALGGLEQFALVRGGAFHQLAEVAVCAVEVFLIRRHPSSTRLDNLLELCRLLGCELQLLHVSGRFPPVGWPARGWVSAGRSTLLLRAARLEPREQSGGRGQSAAYEDDVKNYSHGGGL